MPGPSGRVPARHGERKVETRGAVHHIDLTVGDLVPSTAFYDQLLPLIGFRRL
jgi:hypothetical protein